MLKTRYPEEHLNNVLKVQKLCDTIAGNPCYILTITTDVRKNDISLASAVAQGKGGGDSSTQASSAQDTDKQRSSGAARDNHDTSAAESTGDNRGKAEEEAGS